MSDAERRAHARVAIPLRATVEAQGKTSEVALRDISKGGTFIYAEHSLAPAGERLKLTIWYPDGQTSLAIHGEVARTVVAPASEGGGILGIGVRFDETSKTELQGLERLLEAVTKGPPISTFLRVRCGTDAMSEAIMQEISQGGLSLVTDRKVASGERVEVQVAAPDGTPISLRGRVSRVEESKRGALNRTVRIEFDELSEDGRADLDALLAAIVKA